MFLKSSSSLLREAVLVNPLNCVYKVQSIIYKEEKTEVICEVIGSDTMIEFDLKDVISNKLSFFNPSDILLLLNTSNNNKERSSEPLHYNQRKYYMTITIMFTVLLLFSNIAETKICNFFGYAIGAGTIIFPLLYILSDILTEVYGFTASRKTIWIGFCYSCLFSGFIYIVCLLPASEYWSGQPAFLEIFSTSPRIVVGSVTSYFVGELLNTTIIASLKIKLKGRYFALRAIFSTFVGSLLESALFGLIAFSGRVPFDELINMILMLTVIKVMYEVLFIPITITFVNFLKKVEGINTFEKPSLKGLLPLRLFHYDL